MITAKIEAATLGSFYEQLVRAQQQAHGDDYTSHHAVIRRLAQECSSYAELGVKQGATLACALLAGFDVVWGIDRDLSLWRPFRPLFESWSWDNKATFDTFQQDSRLPFACDVDVLFIDSTHTAPHLREELQAHAGNVHRYILVHDTQAVPTMRHELERFCADSRWKLGAWTVEKHEPRNVGWTLLSRQA